MGSRGSTKVDAANQVKENLRYKRYAEQNTEAESKSRTYIFKKNLDKHNQQKNEHYLIIKGKMLGVHCKYTITIWLILWDFINRIIA